MIFNGFFIISGLLCEQKKRRSTMPLSSRAKRANQAANKAKRLLLLLTELQKQCQEPVIAQMKEEAERLSKLKDQGHSQSGSKETEHGLSDEAVTILVNAIKSFETKESKNQGMSQDSTRDIRVLTALIARLTGNQQLLYKRLLALCCTTKRAKAAQAAADAQAAALAESKAQAAADAQAAALAESKAQAAALAESKAQAASEAKEADPKAEANKKNFIFISVVSGVIAALSAHFLDSLVRGNHIVDDFGLEQSAVMCVAVCAIISFLHNKSTQDKKRNINKATMVGFLLFLLLPSAAQLSPAFFALVDQLRLPILVVFAGFFLCQAVSVQENLGKISGNTLAYGGALAFAYPLVTLWVQSGDNINQFAQTMFKAHCPEAVAAIVGIVLSLGMLAYSYSDEIRGGCYRLWYDDNRIRGGVLQVFLYPGMFGVFLGIFDLSLMIANLVGSNDFAAFQQHAFLTIGSEVLLGIALLGALTYAVSKKPETVSEVEGSSHGAE
jgi:hypothetical protein